MLMKCGVAGTLFFVLLLGACSSEPDTPPSSPVNQNSATPPIEPEEVANEPEALRVAIRHILLRYKTPEEEADARTLAQSIRSRIQAGEDMGKLAKEFSTDGTAPRGGFLGAAERGAWVQAFEDAAFALSIGELTVVDTQYGLHLLRREPLQEVRLMHLVIAHKDSKNIARERSFIGQRSRETAQEMAETAHDRLSNGALFSEVADELSDGPMAQRGANLGWFVKGELGPVFDEVAFDLSPEQISEVFETVFGFHIIQRLE